LLELWGPKLGLIGLGDRIRVWDRHVLDSLRVLRCVGPDAATLVDVGSGAGLPGIPVAIALPARTVTLLEPKSRRAAFLELALEKLSLRNVTVVRAAAEEVHDTFDVVMARALASARKTWGLAGQLVGPGGALLYFAGASWNATEDWMSVEGVSVSECAPSTLESRGPIVMIRRGEPLADASP
jgi:16S rRNA (guanine527-N7)-methyltransferase